MATLKSSQTTAKVYRPSFLDTQGDLRPSVERELVTISNAFQNQMPKIDPLSGAGNNCIMELPLGDQILRFITATAVFNTGATGEVDINFPKPFKKDTIPFLPVVCNGDGGSGGNEFFSAFHAPTNTHFTVKVMNTAGQPVVNQQRRVNYFIMGYA